MTPLSLFMLGIATLVAIGAVAILTRHSRLIYAACLAVTLALAATAILALASPPETAALPLGVPWLGVHLRFDALSAWFAMIVNAGAAAASLYAIGYGAQEPEPVRVLPFYATLLAGINLVLIADDAYSFLLAWEVMSLTCWAMVMARHRAEANARAGYIYLLMAAFGAMSLLLGFALLGGPAGGFDFATMRANHPAPLVAAAVLALALIGAGSKAGLAPLHVWLPLADPAAPSHVAALMSGVVTKVAVYGCIRITFDLLGDPAWWWSLPVLIVGGLTAALGVLHALMERDLPRLLAYSTIENVGIIFLTLGLALAFRANVMPAAAALALTAGLFHAFNHMLSKSVLFFGAGAVQTATGTRNIELLGGLIHRMPISSAAFLLAAMAISALPPLNGFASEWLAFQAIFISPALPQWGLKLLVPAVGTMLALSAALVAGCFVRAFGILYLGRPRTSAAAAAHETDRFSIAAMLALCALCVLAGLFPGVIIDALASVTNLLVLARMPIQGGADWMTIVPVENARSSYNGLLIAAFIAIIILSVLLATRLLGNSATRRARLWDCGYPGLGPTAQYTAASLSQPIRNVMGSIVFRSHERVDMPAPGDTRAAGIHKSTHDLSWEGGYAPILRAVVFISGHANRLQFLTIRRYLGLVFMLLILLLVLLGIGT